MHTSVIDLQKLLFNFSYLHKDNIGDNLKNYAIIHGASSNNVYNKMQFYQPKMKSLFIEKYDKKLYTIAPILVDLNELKKLDDAFIPFILKEAREENAVIFFSSYYGFDELHQYFTKLALSSTPTARTLYTEKVEYEENISFFYTVKAFPNHVRSSLVSEEKFKEYFYPVVAYLVPLVDDMNSINIYSATDNYSQLSSIRFQFNQNIKPVFINLSKKDEQLLIPNHVYITPEQIKVFDEIASEKFVKKFITELKEDGYKFPYDDKELFNRAKEAVNIADNLSLKTDGETAHLILMNFYLTKKLSIQKQDKFLEKVKKLENYGERMEYIKKVLLKVQKNYIYPSTKENQKAI